MSTRFFRASIGTVIYNNDGQVAFFERLKHPEGIWQFQQGGIDLGENLEQALWRELHEEVGLTKDDIEIVTERPDWTLYEDSPAVTDSTISRMGQVHHWYFLKLRPEVCIDLDKATDKEFKNWKWATFAEAITLTRPDKRHVYRALEEFFSTLK